MGTGTIPTSGNLKEHSVTRLLQTILQEGISGSLEVSRGNVSRTLYLKDGMIIYATSTESADRLGEIFVAQGKLTRAEVREAFKEARRRNALLGRILLVDGMISSQELFHAVTAQVVAILERMKSWRKGDFVFEGASEPEAGTVLLRIPLALYLGVEDKKHKIDPSSPGKEEKGAGEWAGSGSGTEVPEAPGFAEGDAGEGTVVEDAADAAAAGEAAPEAGGEEPPEEGRGEDGGWGEVEISLDEAGEGKAETGADDPVDRSRLVEEIVFNVQEVRRRSGRGPHALLGVHEEAGLTEVQDAYQYLSKTLHPDHYPPELPEDVAGDARDLFREITSAHDEASSALAKGIDTSGRMTSPSEAVISGDQTRRLFYRAKEQMAKGNYWQATDALRQVVRKRPKEAMYRNLLGFCLMQTGRRLHEAEEHVREAIRLEPGNPDYITNLGLVYKAGRFYSKAKDMFLQALIYDKRHKMARRELREVSRLVDTGEAKPIWKKIFGK